MKHLIYSKSTTAHEQTTKTIFLDSPSERFTNSVENAEMPTSEELEQLGYELMTIENFKGNAELSAEFTIKNFESEHKEIVGEEIASFTDAEKEYITNFAVRGAYNAIQYVKKGDTALAPNLHVSKSLASDYARQACLNLMVQKSSKIKANFDTIMRRIETKKDQIDFYDLSGIRLEGRKIVIDAHKGDGDIVLLDFSKVNSGQKEMEMYLNLIDANKDSMTRARYDVERDFFGEISDLARGITGVFG